MSIVSPSNSTRPAGPIPTNQKAKAAPEDQAPTTTEAPLDGPSGDEGYSAVAAVSLACRKARSAFSELGFNWPIVIWISLVHVLALLAPFFFTWPALLTCVFMAFLTGSFGVCMGYHRLLTHKSFQTYRPIKWLLALLGGLSGEGSALTWVAQHRKHHAFSDHESTLR